ncbi:unnamed protein product (macronuclear) [Paramecium tetraurelia]|uniref:Centrosomal protein of 162 kDa n=1 Tax=Paramecium tetraurelia TaxID=5888 RepID=A0CTH5_PARTE|nr:uncharacterized protein GSPATT00010326001 [Paramecium tetraurelia]CAK74092.1 unnamed protein product [Paramecium tetraurelia]|eukprot:XP_001441489.1 hypothetical protein (macronuclear) [Paramecium tetraurelia strain d4-2]
MHQRHSKLFESGGEAVKRNLLESYSMQNRKPNSNEDQQLREQVERLTNELTNLKNKDKDKVYIDKQIQCEDKKWELLNELIKQKDKSIEQYEKQIISFKNMILQSNQQKKELLEKLEKQDPMKKSQVLKVSQNTQTDFSKVSQTQQTDHDFGITLGVKQTESTNKVKQQESKLVQTEAKSYNEIALLNQDEMYREIEQYKQILREYDLENRRLKSLLQPSRENISKDTQTTMMMEDKSIQMEDETVNEMGKVVQEYQRQIEDQKQLQKRCNQLQIDMNTLKKQYDQLVSDYYFVQSESKVSDKKIKELNEEVEQLKFELQSKDPSVSSAETVTSPKDSQRSFKKKGNNYKVKNNAQPTYFNPQNVDELILTQEENQKLLLKISELKKELVEAQKGLKTMQEELATKEQMLLSQGQELVECQTELRGIKVRIDSVNQLEQRVQEQEFKYTDEIHKLSQKLAILNSDYLGMKVINQTLHSQLDKYQNRLKQQQSP